MLCKFSGRNFAKPLIGINDILCFHKWMSFSRHYGPYDGQLTTTVLGAQHAKNFLFLFFVDLGDSRQYCKQLDITANII